jgi:hypothetical protein
MTGAGFGVGGAGFTTMVTFPLEFEVLLAPPMVADCDAWTS